MISLSKIEKEIKKIEQDVANCRKCDLWKKRNNPVAGEGSVTTKVMFIGEAPGYNEDMQGRPFVGKAGKILDELLYSVGFDRKEIYIANILKCRPLKNRNPLKKEIKACTSYLDKQIMVIKPKVIVTLGNFASSYVLEKFGFKAVRIGKIHGKIFHIKNLLFDTRVIPSYHPAAAVYNPNMKNALMKDFKSIIKAL